MASEENDLKAEKSALSSFQNSLKSTSQFRKPRKRYMALFLGIFSCLVIVSLALQGILGSRHKLDIGAEHDEQPEQRHFSAEKIFEEQHFLISAFQDQNRKLSEDIENLNYQLYDREVFIEDLEKKLQDIQRADAQLQDLSPLEELLAQKEFVENLRETYQELQNSLNASVGKIAEMQKTLEEIETNHQQELANKEQDYHEVRQQLEDLILTSASEKEALISAIQQLESMNEELKVSFKENAEIVNDLESQLVGQKQELEAALTSLKEARESRAALESELKEAVEKARQSEQTAALIEQNLLQLEKDKFYLTNKNQRLEKENQLLLNQISSLRETETQAIQLQKQLQEKEEFIKKLAKSVAEQKSALQKIETAREELAKELRSTRQEYVQLLKELGRKEPIRSPLPEGFSWESNTAEAFSPPPAPTHDLTTHKRTHTVAPGETLSSISLYYYGTTKRWHEIFEANSEVLTNQNKIRPGLVLIIP